MLLRTREHAIQLNNLISSMKDTKRFINPNVDAPPGIFKITTPMDGKYQYIMRAFELMFGLWPVFPVMFCLEYSGIIMRNDTQVVFAITDLVIKTAHSYCLDMYKQGLCDTVVPYGFLDTSVLYELELTSDQDIYSQLKSLSTAIYGDLLVGRRGNLHKLTDAGLNYQSMLVAKRLNHNIKPFKEIESSSEHGSREMIRQSSFNKKPLYNYPREPRQSQKKIQFIEPMEINKQQPVYQPMETNRQQPVYNQPMETNIQQPVYQPMETNIQQPVYNQPRDDTRQLNNPPITNTQLHISPVDTPNNSSISENVDNTRQPSIIRRNSVSKITPVIDTPNLHNIVLSNNEETIPEVIIWH